MKKQQMMKFLPLKLSYVSIFFLLSLLGCGEKHEGQPKQIEEFYPSGGLKEYSFLNNGIDTRVKYTEEGTVKYVEEVRGGERNGLVKEYYPSGKLESEHEYILGQKHGDFVSFYKSGRVHQTGTYYKGRRLGAFKTYTCDEGKTIIVENEVVQIKGEDFTISSFQYVVANDTISKTMKLEVQLDRDIYKEGENIYLDVNYRGAKFDSTKIIIGEINEDFEVFGLADTLFIAGSKATLLVNNEGFGDNVIRGVVENFKTVFIDERTYKVYSSRTYFHKVAFVVPRSRHALHGGI